MTPELLNYIKGNQAKGVPEDQIRQILQTSGWKQADIDSAFLQLAVPPSLLPPFPIKPSSTQTQSKTLNLKEHKLFINKRALIIVIAIIFIILAGGSSYFLFSKKGGSNINSLSNTAEELKNLNPSNTQDQSNNQISNDLENVPVDKKSTYSLPDNLSYSLKNGWSTLSGKNWALDVKNEWKLQSISGSNIFYNNPNSTNYISIGVQESTNKNYLLDLQEEALKQGHEVLNFQPNISLNRQNAGVIFLRPKNIAGGAAGLVSIHVVIDKNGKLYDMLISTKDNFYGTNQGDIFHLIASFRLR